MGSESSINADSNLRPLYTPVSIWWACWAGVWTAVMASGMAYLIIHQNTPTLHIQGISLLLLAVALLHVYWTVV
jgi:multidrug transporter EmrE-like cation transporter